MITQTRSFRLGLFPIAGLFLAGLPSLCPGEQEVTVVTVRGDEHAGVLSDFEVSKGFLVGGKGFKSEDVAEVLVHDVKPLPMAERPKLHLRNGDRLNVKILSGNDTVLKVSSELLGELELKNDLVLGLSFHLRTPLPSTQIEAFFGPRKLDQDLLLTAQGEAIAGFLVKFSENQIEFEAGGQKRSYPLEQLAAFRYAALEEFKADPGLVAQFRLADGSFFRGRPLRYVGGKVEIQAPMGAGLWKIAMDAIKGISFKGGKLVFLSELTPQAEEKPLIGGMPLVFTWKQDRSTSGGPLKIGAKEYEKGVGVHSFCRLSYRLESAFALFLAEAGLDTTAKDEAQASWKVLGDGKVLAEGVAKAGAAAKKLRLEIQGVKTLDLVCDYGPDEDDAGDHLNWANARLVKP